MKYILTLLLLLTAFPAAFAADSDESSRDVLMNLSQFINAGSADKASELWTDDAVLIDQSGNEIAGRDAIRARFQEARGEAIAIHPDRVDHLTPDLAFVVGSTSRGEGPAMTPVGKFSALLVRKDNRWLISRATDTAVQATAAEHLQQLDWLAGKWTAGGNTNLEAHWAPGKNFLLLEFEKKSEGKVETDTHIIGWDPNSNCVVSWHFDYLGGFGHGQWNKQANQWLIDFTGVAADGAHTYSLNLCSPVSADEFTWKAARKGIGAISVADNPIVTWKRTGR
jgi:uncharacterized protein (TIGR02246 family)